MDNLERAIVSAAVTEEKADSSAPQNNNIIREGVDLVHKELQKTLEKYGVNRIESVGKPFDPAFHEAVMQEENDNFPENTVVKEFHKGYKMHDRILRPAMVVVSKVKSDKNGKT